MTAGRYTRLYSEINAAIKDRSKSNALLRCMKRGRDSRNATLTTLPGGAAFREDVQRVKARCIEDLPRLQEQLSITQKSVASRSSKPKPERMLSDTASIWPENTASRRWPNQNP